MKDVWIRELEETVLVSLLCDQGLPSESLCSGWTSAIQQWRAERVGLKRRKSEMEGGGKVGLWRAECPPWILFSLPFSQLRSVQTVFLVACALVLWENHSGTSYRNWLWAGTALGGSNSHSDTVSPNARKNIVFVHTVFAFQCGFHFRFKAYVIIPSLLKLAYLLETNTGKKWTFS